MSSSQGVAPPNSFYYGTPWESRQRAPSVRGKVNYPIALPEFERCKREHTSTSAFSSSSAASVATEGATATSAVTGVSRDWLDAFVNDPNPSLLARLVRQAVLSIGAGGSRLVASFSHVNVVDSHKLEQYVLHRPVGTPLLTVCNHTSTVDDPLSVSLLLPYNVVSDPKLTRWGLCAQDICFRTTLSSLFTYGGKALPLQRGAGLLQPCLERAQQLLDKGDWVHIFPEGKVVFHPVQRDSYEQDSRAPPYTYMNRWGAAKLAVDSVLAGKSPILVPFIHHSNCDIMTKASGLPSTGARLNVRAGDPIDVADVCERYKRRKQAYDDGIHEDQPSKDYAYGTISLRIQATLQELYAASHPDLPLPLPAPAPVCPSIFNPYATFLPVTSTNFPPSFRHDSEMLKQADMQAAFAPWRRPLVKESMYPFIDPSTTTTSTSTSTITSSSWLASTSRHVVSWTKWVISPLSYLFKRRIREPSQSSSISSSSGVVPTPLPPSPSLSSSSYPTSTSLTSSSSSSLSSSFFPSPASPSKSPLAAFPAFSPSPEAWSEALAVSRSAMTRLSDEEAHVLIATREGLENLRRIKQQQQQQQQQALTTRVTTTATVCETLS